MHVKILGTDKEFEDLLKSSKVLIVDFFALWCAPCRAAKPLFEKYAVSYHPIVFASVDIEILKSTARKYNVTSIPTFIVFKDGNPVETIKGVQQQQLEAALRKHHVADTGATDTSVKGYVNINENIENKQVECLNLQSDLDPRDIFATKGYIESDVDEQLMIYIPFNQAAKVHSLVFKSEIESKAPRTFKIFTNRTNCPAFEDVESFMPSQEFEEITYENGVATVALRFVKFQSVTSLVIFVESNIGDEETTRIDKLNIIGEVLGTTKVENIKKLEDAH
ncbi:Thioredoxin-like protein 1 [Neolecta irregularis DAH-3]|uniref:Thioredoxin-like protein 1 n=1 Tax=Neolecta irregularis (strain DAH-3) TaxID=1198029 RepID=A0A1U7LU22_NEOID|nr:Thioredoxin-like protein 1 [Neolecta irregularis DAH-3]|eukprot:OLL26175.1 Thioredoxin-like protein 1 [Neolecta irregularis DAH-3]